MTLLNCIERIPSKLEEIWENKEERFEKLRIYLENETIEEVVFIASGTSYNSAFTTKSFFEEIGIKASFIYPNIFVNYTHLLNKKALYVMISQGGETKLVYEALKKVQLNGCKNCSITADLNCIIASEADVSILMGCDYEEYLYRTIGYSTTVATCFMLALNLGSKQSGLNIADYENDYKKMIANLEAIKIKTLDWYKQHKFSLMRKQKMIFAGTNDLLAVAQEADIKLMEMVPMMTRTFELEEFIHGPQNSFTSDTGFFIFARASEDKEKATAIANFLKNEIGFCCIVGDIKVDNRDLTLNIQSKHFSPLEYITTMQIIAFKMADDRGRDLSRGVNTQISNYIKKTV
ncbi:MAG: SIS domain-containing protein [Erysipelotrichaceae bacterium]